MKKWYAILAIGLLTTKSFAKIDSNNSKSSSIIQALDFASWLDEQTYRSWEKLLANISPADALRGAVIASPSRHDPDYYYDWVRDGALVMNVVTQQLNGSAYFQSNDIHGLLFEYLTWVRTIQPKAALSGLGEPKYHVDGRPFGGPWGRPQNDGPALRAITLMNWAQHLIDQGNEAFVRQHLYSPELPAISPIKRDLEYVSHHWQQPCFDLWEEVMGEHFYTRMVQLKAMRQGARLANRLGDNDAAQWYSQQAEQLLWAIGQHFNAYYGYIVTTLNTSRSGLDVATVLALLHTYDPQDPLLNFSNDWVLSTITHLERAFEQTYKINKKGFPGLAIGRYPEDVYYGGNPWFLATNALAEYYYRLRDELSSKNSIELTAMSKKFFARLVGEDATLSSNELQITSKLLQELTLKGDSFLERTKIHIGQDLHSMTEQFHRDHGYQLAAPDLTWSYASFITARSIR